MTKIELAERVKNMDMYVLAHKTVTPKMSLNDEEKEVIAELDTHFKEIGNKGVDPHREIAEFIQTVINEEIYNAPDELLDYMFERGDIGEMDDYITSVDPKNTLVVHEAAKGGNVEKSFLDASVLVPTWKNFQIETDISYADVARDGWKTVALITEYAVAAFKNKMFKYIFELVDSAITSGADNYIAEATSAMTPASADALALYVQDVAGYGNGTAVGRSKYIQQMSKFNGFTSDEIINEVHRTGRCGVYDGVSLVPISEQKKLGDGSNLLIDKRVFGIAGKIGTLNMKGEIKVYEDEDNNKEKFHLMFKNFTVGIAFNSDTLKNVCKVELA